MVITFLGSGSAFVNSNENFQSNIVLKVNDKRLLYDCGTTINDALNNVKLEASDIDSIYISHLHADHSGGIEFMAFKTFFSPDAKPTLIGHSDILSKGWKHSWSGGLEANQGESVELKNYFNLITHSNIGRFEFEGIMFEPVKTHHVDNKNGWVPSFGLFFNTGKNKVLITGDTQFDTKTLLPYYKKADQIFHDCEFADYPGGVHAQFKQLSTLPKEIKAKMYLYHYSVTDYTITQYKDMVKEEGFAGLVTRAQSFSIK